MNIQEILVDSVKKNASDIFIISGAKLAYRITGNIFLEGDETVTPSIAIKYAQQIIEMAKLSDSLDLKSDKEMDFSFSMPGTGRFRANIYHQRGSIAITLRYVLFELPNYSQLNIPDEIIKLSNESKGIVLVTGSAGSGKSTTLSCMIDNINRTRSCHIVTIEDPIEFLHKHKKSIISQREIGIDTDNYLSALRAALRQSPNVILLGEMRDYETINVAMTAAETGQLILSTLHTTGAANTVDRIIDVFPTSQQYQIRTQLSMVLQAVISQQLLPDINGNLIPAFEIMLVNNAIKTMIRESKTYQIDTVIQSTAGMQTMDSSILKLFQKRKISADTAVQYATNPEMMHRRISAII